MSKKEPNIGKLINTYKDLNNQKKAITEQLDEVKNTVKEYMEGRGIEAYEIAEGSLSYTKTKRVSYDKAQLVKLFGNKKLEPAKKETEYVLVRITPKKEIE